MAVQIPGAFAFPADTQVPVAVYQGSQQWQHAEYAAVRRFTHVLFEAERPLFGALFGRDTAAEARALAEYGLGTAFICHGTDIRLPSRHAESSPWSPFRDPGIHTERLERQAKHNKTLLDELGRPVFVSTPDLLADVPYATWCPVVIEPGRWLAPAPTQRARPVVLHAPSQPALKGTALIRPAMRGLDREGVVEYRELQGVPHAQMPQTYAAADIVLEQFRLGLYSVAACEAMAAGRVVVGHVPEIVRDTVKRETGINLPIIQATPDTVGEVVRALAADPAARTAAGAAGEAFVRQVHSGAHSARVLLEGWGITT
jgi:glycosyltransferase involved in cell wall biosynthesis